MEPPWWAAFSELTVQVFPGLNLNKFHKQWPRKFLDRARAHTQVVGVPAGGAQPDPKNDIVRHFQMNPNNQSHFVGLCMDEWKGENGDKLDLQQLCLTNGPGRSGNPAQEQVQFTGPSHRAGVSQQRVACWASRLSVCLFFATHSRYVLTYIT